MLLKRVFFAFMLLLVLLFPKIIYIRKSALFLLFTCCISFNQKSHSFILISQIISIVYCCHCHYHYHCLRTRPQFWNVKNPLLDSLRQSIFGLVLFFVFLFFYFSERRWDKWKNYIYKSKILYYFFEEISENNSNRDIFLNPSKHDENLFSPRYVSQKVPEVLIFTDCVRNSKYLPFISI